MTALVKGSVTRGLAPPPPPEAHVIKYARGGSIHRIELYGRSFIRYFSELASIFKKSASFKTFKQSPATLSCPFGEIKRSHLLNQFVTDRQTDTQKK